MQNFEVPTDPLDESSLCSIREEQAGFILSQVVNKKGEFHYTNPGSLN